MKKVLNVKLQRNPSIHNHNDYNAQVITVGNIVLSEIVDEMIKEDKEMDKEMVLKILNVFNNKAADLVISGYNVDTNLVTLSPAVKGSFYGGKFNHELSSVDISIKFGFELNKALMSNNFQINEVDPIENNILIEQSAKLKSSSDNNIDNDYKSGYTSSLLNPEREPACGMAFRRWLCNS